jgi:hypothetical protein
MIISNMYFRLPMHTKKVPQRLLGEVQLFRIRVATAESRLKVLREEARQAKRRRKEAKRIAQFARKQFKRSKAELAELRQALAEAEVKLFQAGGRAQARKMAKPKAARTPPRRARVPKKSKPAPRMQRRVEVLAVSRAPRRPVQKSPVQPLAREISPPKRSDRGLSSVVVPRRELAPSKRPVAARIARRAAAPVRMQARARKRTKTVVQGLSTMTPAVETRTGADIRVLDPNQTTIQQTAIHPDAVVETHPQTYEQEIPERKQQEAQNQEI